jgi:hypothetical protein
MTFTTPKMVTLNAYMFVFRLIIKACESLNGFNLMGRYLIVLYYNMTKTNRVNLQQKEAEIQQLRQRYQIND